MARPKKEVTRQKQVESFLAARKEPFLKESEYSSLKWTLATNWYNANLDGKTIRAYLLDYVSIAAPESLDTFRSIPDSWLSPSIAAIARMVCNQSYVPEHHKTFLDSKIRELLSRDYSNLVKMPKKKNNNNVHLNYIEKLTQCLYYDKDNYKPRDILKGLSSPVLYNIKVGLVSILEEYESIETDKEVAEYYAKTPRARIRGWIIGLKSAIAVCDAGISVSFTKTLENNKDATDQPGTIVLAGTIVPVGEVKRRGRPKGSKNKTDRRPIRKGNDSSRKETNVSKPEKPVASADLQHIRELSFLRLQNTCEEHGLTSLPMETILKAKTLVLYNTKYAAVHVLYSKNNKGFSVYRMAITEYDEKRSFSKRLGNQASVMLAKMKTMSPDEIASSLMKFYTSKNEANNRTGDYVMIFKAA